MKNPSQLAFFRKWIKDFLYPSMEASSLEMDRRDKKIIVHISTYTVKFLLGWYKRTIQMKYYNFWPTKYLNKIKPVRIISMHLFNGMFTIISTVCLLYRLRKELLNSREYLSSLLLISHGSSALG